VCFDECCVVRVVAALCIFSLLELREYALVGGEQPFDRADAERQRVWRRRLRAKIGESYRQAKFAARRCEDNATSFGVRRGNDADELQVVAVKRVTWISNLDGLAWRKTEFDRGSYSGGVYPPHTYP